MSCEEHYVSLTECLVHVSDYTKLIWYSILGQVWAESCESAYFFAQVLIWYYNHIGWISDSCGSPSNVGEDYFCNQDMSGV